MTDGTIEFTPESQGAHTVRYTLIDSNGNEYVETAKISAQESSNAWPASVRAVEGTCGTYALAGDELREVTDNGNTVEIAALMPEGSTPSGVHVYLDEAGINADGDIEVVSLFTTGYRKPIYSQPTVRARIALRSIKNRSESTTSSTGCTLLSIRKQTESCIHGCFRRIRSRSHESFSLN